MNKRNFTLGASLIFACTLAGASQAQVTFSDNFNPPSSLWNNYSGSWTASGGKYYAQNPNNNPFASTWLPYDVNDLSLTVHVDNLTDGGILLRGSGTSAGNANGPNNTVALILGGNGYGSGVRGGSAGTSAYWSTAANGKLNEATGVFAVGGSYDLTVTAVGNTFSLFVNGSSTAATTLTLAGYSHGLVGLYDDQPGPSGSGSPMTFSNFGLTANAVPEPSSFALFGLGALGFIAARRRR